MHNSNRQWHRIVMVCDCLHRMYIWVHKNVFLSPRNNENIHEWVSLEQMSEKGKSFDNFFYFCCSLCFCAKKHFLMDFVFSLPLFFSLPNRLCPLWYYYCYWNAQFLRDLFSVNDMSLWLFLVDHNICLMAIFYIMKSSERYYI